MGGYFGLPGSADHFVPHCARWKQFGFGSQALCFFGKAGFKGLGWFETATLHDTTSCLRVLTVGFSISDPNMQSQGGQFHSAQISIDLRQWSAQTTGGQIRTVDGMRTNRESIRGFF
jgi:hypothetical protein